MKSVSFSFFKSLAGRLVILALVCGLYLAGMSFFQSASADSGGFPTPTETLYLFPTWTPLPSPTATFILLPTQASAAESGQTAQKGLAAPAESAASEVQAQELNAQAAQQGGMGSGGKFAIGLAIGLVFIAIGLLLFWLLRRTGVLG
jgi:hypothetical protein